MVLNEERKSSILPNVLVLLAVMIAVVACYTFYNAKGASYLSNEPQACNNCHIMNEVYNDYSKSTHSRQIAGVPRATCNDCHLPHEFVSKWIAKAQSGIGHAYAFTFKINELPTNLSANAASKQMLQDNCVRCHIELVQTVVNPTTNIGHSDKSLSCVSCHEDVGHKRGF